MASFTAIDNVTKEKVTFDWTGDKPPTDSDIQDVFDEKRIKSQTITSVEASVNFFDNLNKLATIQGKKDISIGVIENMANLVTTTFGVPAAGFAGLFTLPFGLDRASNVVEKIQEATTFNPKTTTGKSIQNVISAPFRALGAVGGFAGEKIAETGRPNLAATVDTAITGAPAIIAGGKILGRATGISQKLALDRVNRNLSVVIDRSINKAIKPTSGRKETFGQIQQFRNKARVAVKEVIANKENLILTDEAGLPATGLPKSLNQFSQAIEQTKSKIFVEYDALAKQAQGAGVLIDLKPLSIELNNILKSEVLRDFSPETIKYAQGRLETLVRRKTQEVRDTGIVDAYGKPVTSEITKETGRGFYTAVETQEAIKLLNQSLDNFYKNPTPDMMGKAYVDAMIANNLRTFLDNTISRITNQNYQGLKNRYGALRTVEKDVTKRALADARKDVKGLIDFTDVFSGFHVMRGLLKADPATVSAGIISKAISHSVKVLNDPNRMVKNMFKDAEVFIDKIEKLQRSQPQ